MERLAAWATQPHVVATAKETALLGLAWTLVELLSYLLLRPLFLRLLDGNPKLRGNTAKQAKTAVQMMPRVVCFIHNVIQIPLALSILLDPAFLADPIFAVSARSRLLMFISVGYFLYDSGECVLRYEHEGPDFLLHGVVCFIVFLNLAHTNVLHWFGAGFLMWELSTPFMHLRWFLYKVGRGDGPLYRANALTGMLVFFLCRNLWGPYLSYRFWVDSAAALATPRGAAALPLGMIWGYRAATVLMNALNAWWFSKMLRILLDAVRAHRAAGDAAATAIKKQH